MAFSLTSLTDTATTKAVNYGNKYLNEKLSYGVNYARNLIASYDPLNIFGLAERWTILDESGETALEFDAFIKSSVKAESKVTSMPVEGGGFVSYNKTISPCTLNVTLSKRGTPEYLAAFVTALLNYANGTDLLSVVTPEQEYKSMNLTSVSFDRAAENGTDVIYAECAFTEVREVESEYTSVRIAKKVSRGRQQGKNQSMLSLIKDAIH